MGPPQGGRDLVEARADIVDWSGHGSRSGVPLGAGSADAVDRSPGVRSEPVQMVPGRPVWSGPHNFPNEMLDVLVRVFSI